jgi:hypothetical protein
MTVTLTHPFIEFSPVNNWIMVRHETWRKRFHRRKAWALEGRYRCNVDFCEVP